VGAQGALDRFQLGVQVSKQAFGGRLQGHGSSLAGCDRMRRARRLMASGIVSLPRLGS
jgi:hypothetical protein